MLIALLVVSTVAAYGLMIGVQYHLSFKYFNWAHEGDVAAGIFWPLFFFPTLARVTAKHYLPALGKMMRESQARRAEQKALPAVQIKPGAKLDSMADYQKLKKLLTDFEIENGFDRLLEE